MQKDPHSYLSDFGIICNQLSVKPCKYSTVKVQLHHHKFKTYNRYEATFQTMLNGKGTL